MLRVRRRSENVLVVSLGFLEAEVLRTLPGRLREILEDPDSNRRVTERLFPRAYSDPRKEEEYRRLLGEDLARRKLEGVDVFEKTFRACGVRKNHVEILIRAEDFQLWVGFVNDVRLLLGTELGIESDDWSRDIDFDHPRADDLALLHFLSWLEEELLRGSGFEPPGIDPDKREG